MEYRINREQIFKEINHPFLFIHYKEKELTLIGSDEELAHFDSKFSELMEEQEQSLDKKLIITQNYLLPLQSKGDLVEIKQLIEQQVPKSKIMIYDPTQPRKNITISLTGTKETLGQAKEVLVNKTMGLECL